MTGFWLYSGYDNVFYSKARSMARYGILIQNNGIWNTDTLLHDTAYFNQMINTSQTLNNSYGYLWWLNGKSSYMLPTLQTIFPGSYAPDAPSDMIAGLGKNGQILSISPSTGLAFVRMGNQPNSPVSEVTTLFCNQIWKKLNAIMCNSTSYNEQVKPTNSIYIYPNPAQTSINIAGLKNAQGTIEIFNTMGETVMRPNNQNNIDVTKLQSGIYFIEIRQGALFTRIKLAKN